MKYLLIFSIVFLSGCSSIEVGAQYVATYYCSKPAKDRMLLRYNVNHFVYPDKIEITCAEPPNPPELPDEVPNAVQR